MANPRQRQKQRTSRTKLTRRTGDRLKKVNIKGNAIIAANWDKQKTLKQNYERLGLVSNPNINPSSGGVEKLYPEEKKTAKVDENGLRANEAIIKRDEEGNVIDVIYSALDSNQFTSSTTDNAAAPRTKVVEALEERAKEEKVTMREASTGEVEWLRRIVAKYGDDYARAARDARLNPMQQTAANIKKRVVKAGLA